MATVKDYAERAARRYALAKQKGAVAGYNIYYLETDGFAATIDADGYQEYLQDNKWHTFWDQNIDQKVDEQHELSSQLAKLFDNYLGV